MKFQLKRTWCLQSEGQRKMEFTVKLHFQHNFLFDREMTDLSMYTSTKNKQKASFWRTNQRLNNEIIPEHCFSLPCSVCCFYPAACNLNSFAYFLFLFFARTDRQNRLLASFSISMPYAHCAPAVMLKMHKAKLKTAAKTFGGNQITLCVKYDWKW